MNYQEQYDAYLARAKRALEDACRRYLPAESQVCQAARYSLMGGGKRVRAVLVLSVCDMLGGDAAAAEQFAAAVEMLHCYSLIHDDLPAMDDDDMRRGRPSNHKVFGEANAILAGDALLSYAFDILLREAGRGGRHLSAARTLSVAAGADGMVAGQSADLLYTGKNGGEEELRFIYRNKTGRLMAAPVAMAADLAGKNRTEAEAFGIALGELFQLTDDILDEVGESAALGKTAGKDAAEDKLTAVKIYGLEGAREKAAACAARCHDLLSAMDADKKFLAALVDLVLKRDR